MKDIYDILNHVRSSGSGPWALATLVTAAGSSYRRPGACMLVNVDGESIGSLSGGCLEEEVAVDALETLRSGMPKLIRFDTRRRFGCNGEIQIFIERIELPLFSEIWEKLDQRRSCSLETVFATLPREEAGSVPLPRLGTRLIGSSVQKREANSLPAEVTLVREVHPPIRLLVVGDGTDSAPIREMSKALGWIPIEVSSMREIDFEPDRFTAALVKTHNYGKDFAALQELLPLNLTYVGLIGPRRRRDQLLHDLLDIGISMNAGLFAPAGLDLHSETPVEIALAVVSEIQRVFAGGTGASLRERKVSIHMAAKAGLPNTIDSAHSAAILPD